MPKRSFFIKDSELDNYQIQIINSTASDLIVQGCAGSGKSILALWKAKQIQNERKGSFLFVVKMNSLKQYMHDGINQVGIDSVNVESFNKCFSWSKQDNEWIRGAWKKGTYDYILVDEAQDLPIEDILLLKQKAKHIFYYGDSAQQLMEFGGNTPASMSEIIFKTKIHNENLVFNYRLPKKIARVAFYLNSEGDDIVRRCKNEGTELPFIFNEGPIDKQLDFIQTTIQNRDFKDVGIFFRSRKEVEYARDYYRNKKNFDVEAKINENATELDFNSDNPKLMTYHSSKGLQFEAVFLPNCESSDNGSRNPLYVAMTRTYQSLYILHSGNLSSFFDDVPMSLYKSSLSQTEEL